MSEKYTFIEAFKVSLNDELMNNHDAYWVLFKWGGIPGAIFAALLGFEIGGLGGALIFAPVGWAISGGIMNMIPRLIVAAFGFGMIAIPVAVVVFLIYSLWGVGL